MYMEYDMEGWRAQKKTAPVVLAPVLMAVVDDEAGRSGFEVTAALCEEVSEQNVARMMKT